MIHRLLAYKKVCPNCREDFTAKRLNQDYCSPNCRVQFNNYRARQVRDTTYHIVGETNDILLKNREILHQFAQEKNVPISTLVKAGFALNYVTNYQQPSTDVSPIFYCYDYAYSFLTQETLNIKKITYEQS